MSLVYTSDSVVRAGGELSGAALSEGARGLMPVVTSEQTGSFQVAAWVDRVCRAMEWEITTLSAAVAEHQQGLGTIDSAWLQADAEMAWASWFQPSLTTAMPGVSVHG